MRSDNTSMPSSALTAPARAIAPDASKYFIPSASEASRGVVPYSAEYYGLCFLGGVLACGPTHASLTPLDVIKTRRQVDAKLYSSNLAAVRTIIKSEGVGGLLTGFGATFVGYSFQGAGKYGFYEIFKKNYSDLVGADIANRYKTGIYLAASASAELIADVFLCPWEAIKVRTQTTYPPFAKNLLDGYRKMTAEGGVAVLFKGLGPLMARQVPYTMVKFAAFENIVDAIYARLPRKKREYSLLAQTGVSFAGGYIAGIFAAIVSNPADVLVSKINNESKEGEGLGAATRRIYGRIGFSGLWQGVVTRIFMLGTLTGMQWLIYDSFKGAVGLPTSG